MATQLLDRPLEQRLARIAAANQLRQLQGVFLLVSLAAYLLAFVLPNSFNHHPVLGYELFFCGLFWCWLLPPSLPWWANVIFWLALSRCGRGDWTTGTAFALWAVGLAWLSPVFFPDIMGLAFYTWMGSMAALTVSGITLCCLSPNK